MSEGEFGHERLRTLLTHPNAVLRHDVDYEPTCALQMAKFEAELGVTSTYYVRPMAEYDSSSGARQAIKQIPGLGHALAPHVNLVMHREAKVSDWEMKTCAEQDYDDLNRSFPMVRKVSFHAPPRDVYWREVEGFEHAMGPKWELHYIGDSRGVFRFSPEQALSWGTIQLNTHPEWWWLSDRDAAKLREIEASKP